MNLYREVDFEKEPCVFVGVHCLRWHEHPDQPTVGFVEVELDDIPEVKRLRTQVEVGKLALNAIVQTQIIEAEFKDGVCPVCRGLQDQGHAHDCTWGDFVDIIKTEMEDQ